MYVYFLMTVVVWLSVSVQPIVWKYLFGNTCLDWWPIIRQSGIELLKFAHSLMLLVGQTVHAILPEMW